MTDKRYEQIPHTADLAAEIRGRDLKMLFENAAFCMADMAYRISSSAKATEDSPVSEGRGPEKIMNLDFNSKAPDMETLLVGWLNEILYHSFRMNAVFFDIHVRSLGKTRIISELKGEEKHRENIKHEIKAATYHNVKIKEANGEFMVTIVFDV